MKTKLDTQITKAFNFINNSYTAFDRLSKAIPILNTGEILIARYNKNNRENEIVWELRSKELELQGIVQCLYDEENNYVKIFPKQVSAPKENFLEAVKTLCTWAHDTLWPSEIWICEFSADSLFNKNEHFLKNNDHFLFVKTPESGKELILTAGPSISERECAYATDAARYGWNNKWSDYIQKFESSFADYVGADYALSTSSCTGALHIALSALDIGPGDEIIVPDITWVATANAILYVGAKPVFADIDESSWCLDPESFESCISSATKAVIPVHLYGHPCDMDNIMTIAEKYGLFVIEDAAPSIGAEYKGRRTGSFGHFAAFSFQGAKLAVTGEGGMLVTSDKMLFDKAKQIWDQGRKPGTFWIERNGLKYKMSNIQAAIGLAQIERNDSMVQAKRRIFSWYEKNLKDISCASLNKEMLWARSIYWMSSLCLHEDAKLSRDELITKLKKYNIDSRPVFPAISQYPIWPTKQESQPTAKFISDHALNLPSGVCLSHSEVEYICTCIHEILNS